ncbi:hypothetical protein SKPI104516_02165 [Skermania piniformis]
MGRFLGICRLKTERTRDDKSLDGGAAVTHRLH